MSWPAVPAGEAPAAREVLLAATESELRSERMAKALLYVVLGLPLGLVYVVVVLGALALGGVLLAFWVGLPVLLAASSVIWRLAGLERRLANRLLQARIAPLPPLDGTGEARVWQRFRLRARSRAFWRGTILLCLKLPLTAVAATTIAAGLTGTVALLVVGARAVDGSAAGEYFGPFALNPGVGVVLCVLAIPVGIVTVAVTDAVAAGLRAVARSLLVTSLPPGAPVRETLARSLGDRTLSIAYWLEDRQAFVDERGMYVPLPEPGSHRAWTAVDYDGRRVAAIIHDVSLEASPELVEAAAAAASLALDNERLKADLRARVQELRASRVRLVEASNSARRKIERDLHDGAQQQLVALAIELGLLRNRVPDNPEALELIDRIDAKLTAALDELRELARGIHPGILSDRGLPPALESLAARAPIEATCQVELPVRPDASVESVAYFVMAEALTNVLKYAQAGHIEIRARYDGPDVVLELQDDGVGGADEGNGTGLQGLRDRVGALEGSLTVVSPPGEGTLVQARIPARPEGPS